MAQQRKKLDVGKILEEDIFLFKVREHRNLAFNFVQFIIEMRIFAAHRKLRGEEYDEKHYLGSDDCYKNAFMIAKLCVEDHYQIGFIIYKPTLYNLGFNVGADWYVVEDFGASTQYFIPKAKPLPYSSRYVSGAPSTFSFHIICNAIHDLFTSKGSLSPSSPNSYRLMNVVLCETMRSNVILKKIASCLTKKGEVWPEVNLDNRDLDIIHNWYKASLVWFFYDIGFHWDPSGSYENLTLASCLESLSLGIDVNEKSVELFDYLKSLDRTVLEEKFRRKSAYLGGLTPQNRKKYPFLGNLSKPVL